MLTDMLVTARGGGDASPLKSLRHFSNVSWFIMRTVRRAWTHSQPKPFSNTRLCRTTGERLVPRGSAGHRSGKERNKFHRIMVKTTVVCFLKRLDINFKHVSQKV